ncbi:MAG: type II secretion system protein [Fibrobacter sp.]|nr:type II secretion system protein [Fibrobacter sp.]
MVRQLKKLLRNKSGFGLLEIVASMLIMSFMFSGIMYLHYYNRVIAVRIHVRNEATRIAQNYLDSLSAQGIHNVQDIEDVEVQGSTRTLKSGVEAYQKYTVNVVTTDISDVTNINVESTSYEIKHVSAKRIDVEVAYEIQGTPFNIKLSSVVE